MRYKSKHNLLRWFIEDHATLPKAYLRSCQKFFDELKVGRVGPKATSLKNKNKNNLLTNNDYGNI